MVRVGDIVGKYRIMELLYETQMSLIFKALSLNDNSVVALKAPHPRLLHSSFQAVRKFEEEGRKLVDLKHSNIVQALSVGKFDGMPYIVMKYLPAIPLVQEMNKNGRASITDVCRLLRPVASALDFANSKGFAHCDVKPGNILVTRQGVPVLVDFGIAQAANETIWDDGGPVGTPAYMSPEQVRGERGTEKSDQYSLAIVAYEMLAGKPPFEGRSNREVWDKQLHAAPPLPSEWPQPVCRVMERALDKDSARRFASSADFIDALEKASQDRSLSFGARSRPEPPQPQPAPPPASPRVRRIPIPESTDPTQTFPSPREAPGAKLTPTSAGKLVPVAILILTVSLVVVGLRWRVPPPPPPPVRPPTIDPSSITVVELRLFEDSAGSRGYGTQFLASRSQSIRWEVRLSYPSVQSAQRVALKMVLRGAKGGVVTSSEPSVTLPGGSATTSASEELGISDPLAPGTYQLGVGTGQSEVQQSLQILAKRAQEKPRQNPPPNITIEP
jgi:serine/threonine protein kinase